MTTSHIPELAEALQRRNLALFIGADLPREATGLPSRADLARALARRRGLDESLSLAEVAQRVSQAGNRWEFTAFIRDALDTAGKSPQPFHLRIIELVKTHQVETIITTAYDNLLELAFRQAGVGINRVVRGADLSFVVPDRPTLIKLYGDAQQPDTLVVTEDDHYALWRNQDKQDLLDEVRAALRRNAILFLGYNLADPDFNLLWREVLHRAGRFARTAYAVWPGLPEPDALMWRDRCIQVLDTHLLAFLESMVAAAPDKLLKSPGGHLPKHIGQPESLSDVLSIYLDHDGHPHHAGKAQWWIRLRIESKKPVNGCWGKVYDVRRLSGPNDQQGVSLPEFHTSYLSWGSRARGLFAPISIQLGDTEYLDLAWRADSDPPIPADELRVASALDQGERNTGSPDWGMRQDFIPLKPGYYLLVLQIWAEEHDTPVERAYRLHWPGPGQEDRTRLVEVTDAAPIREQLSDTEPKPGRASAPPDLHLLRQLELARENLSLIQERKAEYVLEVDVPLQLIREERRLRARIADLEAQLGDQVHGDKVAGDGVGGDKITTHIGRVTGPVHTGAGDIIIRQDAPPPPPDEVRAPVSYFDMQVRIQGFDSEAQGYPVEALLGDGSLFEGGIFRPEEHQLRAAELDPQKYGVTLFEALFSGSVLRAYDRATAYADIRAEGRLRFRLWIDNDAAELHALAWERLHHLVQGAALPIAASGEMPFSRYIGLEQREPTPITERPARMLVAVSNPANLADYRLASLDVEDEVANLTEALDDLQRAGQLQVTLMPGRAGLSDHLRSKLDGSGYQIQHGATSLDNVLRLLTHGEGYHILHVLAHGRFSRRDRMAALLLEGEDGQAQLAKDQDVVTRLASIGSLPHLVFLAACESAKRDFEKEGEEADNPFVGLAPKLIQVGVPAVVAMQDAIPTETARKLAHSFYSYLLEHGVVDRAMNQARLLLFESSRMDWTIPVLFMRLKEGQLFNLE